MQPHTEMWVNQENIPPRFQRKQLLSQAVTSMHEPSHAAQAVMSMHLPPPAAQAVTSMYQPPPAARAVTSTYEAPAADEVP